MFMKGKFDAYVLWPLAKSFQNWIVYKSIAPDFRVNDFTSSDKIGKTQNEHLIVFALTRFYSGTKKNVLKEDCLYIKASGMF